MDLKSLLVDSKTTLAEFPGLDGFEVELANLSRKELVNLRKILIYKVSSCFCIKALLKYNNNIDGIVNNEVTT